MNWRGYPEDLVVHQSTDCGKSYGSSIALSMWQMSEIKLDDVH
jgi:hypothetical protein